ncbi:sensor histidine kinase [Rubrivivax sp. RP6-9]|uniref:sensor histidine kinase n=1 Tax=Rubrivivax sp. RP6-9 TaxID=3415750 RepID=UPI003CC68703
MTPDAAPGSTYRPRLRRRLMQAFVGCTLLVVAVLSALAIVFVYAVEDEFFGTVLQAEVDRQQAHQAAHGSFTAPVLPMVRLHPQGLGLPADIAGQVLRHPGRDEFEGTDGRHYHLRRIGPDGTLLVAEVSGQLVVRRMREELLAWLLAAAAGLTLLAVLVGAWLARRISSPVTALAARVAGIAPDALPQDLSHGLDHDEVGQLARRLDLLHARTRAFIAREQAFTADVSHELRTPLAVLGVAADRLQQLAPAEAQPVVRSIQAAVWQLGRTVEAMLALAREAPPAAGPGQEQALLPVLERLVLAYAPLLDREQVALTLAVPAAITRPWSPSLTHLLIGNLLGNAIAHAQAPRVRIEADADEVRVCNPGLPPAASVAAAPAHPPARSTGGEGSARAAASTGLGLGLAIARRLAARHGLVVELRHHDGQTCAIVRAATATEAPCPPA